MRDVSILPENLIEKNTLSSMFYRVFHEFGQAKFADGGLILGSSQFTQLPQLPLKMRHNLKVVKINSKTLITIT